MTEQAFGRLMENLDSKEWRIWLTDDSIHIHDRVQGKALSWNVHKLGCYNILRKVEFVEFTHLRDAQVCLPEWTPTPAPPTIGQADQEEVGTVSWGTGHVYMPDESDREQEVEDIHLVTNILIITGIGCMVMLICILGLCKQCRRCFIRVCCIDRCCRTSYNVSAMESRLDRSLYNVESLATTSPISMATDSDKSSTLIQMIK